jgi:hypothetical protein
MRDLDFISAKFIDLDIPKERRFLLKYFRGELHKSFLKYYMVFGTHKNFSDHTGYYCVEGLRYRMEDRYIKLNKLYDDCRREMTEESLKTLQILESGKYRFCWLNKL